MISSRVVLIIATLAALACTVDASPLTTIGEFSRSGKIIDAAGAPLQGALVIAKWEACYGLGHCNHFCSGYELTNTDINGNYKITGSHPGSLRILDFYKKGYQYSDIQKYVITMQPDPSRGHARLQNIKHLLSGCSYNQKAVALAGIGRTIFDEVIADLREENRIDEILNVISFIEQQEIGPSAETRTRARRTELYRQPSKVTKISPDQISSAMPEPLPRSFRDDFTHHPYDASSSIAGFSGNTSLINVSFEGDRITIEAELESSTTLNDRNIFGETAVYAASLSGHQNIVSVLLKHGANPDIPNMLGEPPLLAALKNNHIDTATLLINNGASVSGVTGKRAAVWSIKKNQTELLALLLDKGVSIYDEVDGYMLLRTSLSSAKSEIKITLLNRHIQLNEEQINNITNDALWPDKLSLLESLLRNGYGVDKKNTNWPLKTAIQRDNEGAVGLLITHGADVNKPLENGRTPLIEAALLQRQRPIVEKLLKAGSNLDYATKNNETALSVAAQHGDLELMRLLIDAGADVNTGSLLHASVTAVKDTDSIATKLLLENGAKPCNDKKYLDIDIATMAIAARKGRKWLIDEYVSHGCDIKHDITNQILEEAIKGGDFETVSHVIKLGAAVNYRYKDGITPIMLSADDNQGWNIIKSDATKSECKTVYEAVSKTSVSVSYSGCEYQNATYQTADARIVKLLIDAGAEMDRRDTKYGLTALMRAAIIGNTEIATLLIEGGADPSIIDLSGQTAYMHAIQYKHTEVAELLKRERKPSRIP